MSIIRYQPDWPPLLQGSGNVPVLKAWFKAPTMIPFLGSGTGSMGRAGSPAVEGVVRRLSDRVRQLAASESLELSDGDRASALILDLLRHRCGGAARNGSSADSTPRRPRCG